jgi:predicted metal-binding protein
MSSFDPAEIERLARSHGADEMKWTPGRKVRVRQWVRFKCMFGCPTYGHKAGCPPAVPSVSECHDLFGEYEQILIMRMGARLDHPDDRVAWARKRNNQLLKLERQVFLAGFHKAFVLFLDECRICEECQLSETECQNPKLVRPCPEALAVDVFDTVRALGMPIEVLTDHEQAMNRYAFLLVE